MTFDREVVPALMADALAIVADGVVVVVGIVVLLPVVLIATRCGPPT